MSVTFWDFTGEESVRNQRDGQEITRPITIIVDNAADSLDVLKRDIPQLQRWQRHPDQQGFFVDEFSADKVRGTLMWIGSVRWTDTVTENPLDQPARLVGIRTENIASATNRDRRGNAIVNTAGELVAPIPKNEKIKVFTFSKNVPEIVEELLDFEDVINSDEVKIRGKARTARTLLLGKVEFSEEQEANETKYHVCVIELSYRKSGWKHKHASKGYSEIIERRATTKELLDLKAKFIRRNGISYVRERRSITLGDGQKPSEPQMLDADGKWIKDPQPEDIHLIETELFEEVSFNALLKLIAQ